MSDETTPERTPQERFEAANAAFDQLNNMLPPGLPPFQKPPALELMASVNALTSILIDTGVLDGEEFLAAKLSQMAEMTEQCVELARELKRQALGLVVAGQNPQI